MVLIVSGVVSKQEFIYLIQIVHPGVSEQQSYANIPLHPGNTLPFFVTPEWVEHFQVHLSGPQIKNLPG